MPNGHYHAQCQNCAAYDRLRRGRHCTRHDFVLPRVSEVICRDWRVRYSVAREHPADYAYAPALVESEDFRALLPGTLYHYHYSSDASPEPLGSFEELRHLVWSVHLRQDAELGWTLYLGTSNYDLFPAPPAAITLLLDGDAFPFLIADLPRRRATGGTRAPSGAWETHHAIVTQRTIHSQTAPDALRTWLATRLDLPAYLASLEANEFREWLLDSGITALMMATGRRGVYTLRQLDGILYRRYRPASDAAGGVSGS